MPDHPLQFGEPQCGGIAGWMGPPRHPQNGFRSPDEIRSNRLSIHAAHIKRVWLTSTVVETISNRGRDKKKGTAAIGSMAMHRKEAERPDRRAS